MQQDGVDYLVSIISQDVKNNPMKTRIRKMKGWLGEGNLN